MKKTALARASVAACAIAVLLASACKHRDCKPADKLPLRVQTYCGQLALDLKAAAQEFANDAPRMDTMPGGQRMRTQESLRWRSVGISADVRREALVDLQMRLTFCVQAREIDGSRMTALQVNVDTLIKQLGPDLVTGQLPTTAETVRALRDLATLADQVNALPLVH